MLLQACGKLILTWLFGELLLRDDHKGAAAVAYCYRGGVWVAGHEAMPFGATASVLAWDKVGASILKVARERLHLPAFRYVDDYFAAERYISVLSHFARVHVFVCRPGVMEHGLSTFVRLVRALLGPTAIADAKAESGLAVVILGILVQSSWKGVCFNLCPKKAAKWSLQIRTAIDTLHMDMVRQRLTGYRTP